MRHGPALCLAALMSGNALGHNVAIEFLEPVGVGSRSDGGEVLLRWVDDPDPLDAASLSFFARRPALTPFEVVTSIGVGALALHGAEIPVSDALNELRWDARGVEPGCYQPYVLVSDQVEGLWWREAPGQVVVDPLDGGNRPAAIWLTMDPAQPLAEDGTWPITFATDDPDDAPRVTLELVSLSTRTAKELASSIEVPAGKTVSTFVLETRGLTPGAYTVHAIARAGEGPPCDAWFGGILRVPAFPNPGDGGDPAGSHDAGSASSPPAGGCGCASTTELVTAALACLGLGRRRKRSA